jgi:hypothetical protein
MVGHQKHEYIQSQFGRASEVSFGIPYGPPKDIWSMALVIIEIMIGRPLFQGKPKSSRSGCLLHCLEVLRLASSVVGRDGRIFDENNSLKCLPIKSYFERSDLLEKIVGKRDPYLVDFLKKCFIWNQSEWMTASGPFGTLSQLGRLQDLHQRFKSSSRLTSLFAGLHFNASILAADFSANSCGDHDSIIFYWHDQSYIYERYSRIGDCIEFLDLFGDVASNISNNHPRCSSNSRIDATFPLL